LTELHDRRAPAPADDGASATARASGTVRRVLLLDVAWRPTLLRPGGVRTLVEVSLSLAEECWAASRLRFAIDRRGWADPARKEDRWTDCAGDRPGARAPSFE